MERVFNYKYYALHKFSSVVYGILKEEMGEITFHELVAEKIFDEFTGTDVDALLRHADIGDKKMKAAYLLEDSDQYDFTKSYRDALSHITGIKKMAINTNDTTAG